MTKADAYYQKMTETPVSRLIVSLGIPTTVSMLITNIYNLADTYFVGTLGESAQGAIGILFTLQAIIQAIAFMLGHGSGTYVSKALAGKKTDEASRYVSTAFYTGMALGTVLLLFGMTFLSPFMRLLGSTETILPHARDYGMWVLLACPFMIGSLVLNNNLRYEGKAFYAMIGLTIGGVLNILGDWVLIMKCNMGVYGAGLSTAVSQLVSFTILLVLFRKNAQSSLKLRFFTLDKTVHINIVKGGLPSLLRQGLSSISNGLLNNFTKPFGDAAIAAMSVVGRFSIFALCVGLGIGQGFQPVAAFNYEAKKYKRVKKGLLFTMVAGLVLVGIFSVCGLIFAEGIVRIFQKSDRVVDIGAVALRYSCIGFFFLPISVPVNMLFQSIRHAGVASFLSLMRSGLFFIPVLLIGAPLFGLVGVQLAQPIADVLSGLVSIPFMMHFLKNDHRDSVE